MSPLHVLFLQQLGAQILTDLHSQRETIQHARGTLQSTDDSISKARKILSNMSKRIIQNKIILVGVALFLIAGIAIIIYVKVKKN